MNDIESKHKIPLVGVYNYEVFVCPFCGKEIRLDYFDHIIGFADAPIGLVQIIECPECFEKYYSHTSVMMYASFRYSVSQGNNKHYEK